MRRSKCSESEVEIPHPLAPIDPEAGVCGIFPPLEYPTSDTSALPRGLTISPSAFTHLQASPEYKRFVREARILARDPASPHGQADLPNGHLPVDDLPTAFCAGIPTASRQRKSTDPRGADSAKRRAIAIGPPSISGDAGDNYSYFIHQADALLRSLLGEIPHRRNLSPFSTEDSRFAAHLMVTDGIFSPV